MKTMRKSRISMALAAVFAGVGASTQVAAVNLSSDNIGDVVIYPYYTVRDGWTTDFTIINTSDATVAAKVRFHEGRNSREVLDFTVVMSPRDVVSGWVEDTATGPRVRFPDNGETTCIVPRPTGRPLGGSGGTLAFKNFDYSLAEGNWDNFKQDVPDETDDLDRAREGYFTVIEMGSALSEASKVPVAAKHAPGGPPADCAFVESAFSKAGIAATYAEFDRNLNALKGNYALTNIAQGDQAGGVGVTLANFATEASILLPTWTSYSIGLDAWVKAKDAAGPAKADVLAKAQAMEAAVDLCAGTTIYNTNSNDYTADGIAHNIAPPDFDGWNLHLVDGGITTWGALCDGDTVNTQETAGLQAQIIPAIAAFNDSVKAYAKVKAAVELAEEVALSPAKNLIHAQANPDSRWPDLDSGDLAFTLLIDGIYERNQAVNQKIRVPTPGSKGDAVPLDDTTDFLFPMFGLYHGTVLPRGVDAVTALLMRSDAMNEWANNTITGAKSDMVVTMPTKRYYTDLEHIYGQGNPLWATVFPAGYSLLSELDTALPPFTNAFGANGSCDVIGVGIWNRDELQPPNLPVDSSPHTNRSLCWEANVIALSGESLLKSKLGPNHEALNIDTTAILGGPSNATLNGWISLDFDHTVTNWTGAAHYHPAFPGFQAITTYQSAYNWLIPQYDDFDNVNGYTIAVRHTYEVDPTHLRDGYTDGDNWVQTGLPVIGFTFKQRTFLGGDNYGAIFDHSYRRAFDSRDDFGGQWPQFGSPFPDICFAIDSGANCVISGQ